MRPVAATLRTVPGLDTQAFTRDVTQWSLEVFAEAVEEILDTLDDACPEGPDRARTGPRLKDTREVRIGPDRVEIAYLAEHASYTDEGTDPHRIHGNPLLAFDIGGETVIVHYVDHPGTDGTRWWTDTMTDASWQDALEGAAERVQF